MEDDENVLHLLGVGLDEQIRDDTELEDALKMFNAYDTESEKILLAMAFDARMAMQRVIGARNGMDRSGQERVRSPKNDDLDVPMNC